MDMFWNMDNGYYREECYLRLSSVILHAAQFHWLIWVNWKAQFQASFSYLLLENYRHIYEFVQNLTSIVI